MVLFRVLFGCVFIGVLGVGKVRDRMRFFGEDGYRENSFVDY